ncbi:MAG: glycosyltransferase family 4 protein [Nitrospirae bacterium]|nr:glycosyltransferase family 4 protein [Nitrospirota bacterium]
MGDPLKILYIHRSTGATYGGALVDLVRVLERLDRTAFEPMVLLSLGDVHAERFRKIGLCPIHVPLPAFRKAKSLLWLPFAVSRLAKVLVRERVDLVHVNDADDAGIATWACRRTGIPCVVHVRSEMEPEKFAKLRVHRADGVLAVSEAVRSAAIAGGVEEDRMRISSSGCDVPAIERASTAFSARARLGIPPDALVIGSVANIAPTKGYRDFIEAFCQVARQMSVYGIIVGADDHGMRKDLIAQAAQAGYEDRLRFVGFQENVFPFIAAMDLFVLASLHEGFGIVLLEAMALERSVIATDVQGPREIILPGETGVLVPPAAAETLGKAILSLLGNGPLRKAMGQAGRRRVVERFSLDAQVREWESTYRFLVNGVR